MASDPARAIRRPLAMLAAVVLAGSLSACGAGGGEDRATAGPLTPTTTKADAPGVPGPLDFTNAAVGGGTIDFGSYAGRPLAMWFWAPY